jgi:hypothetical protein
MTKLARRARGGWALALLAGGIGTAAAQDEAQFVVVRYHEAARAAELCRDRKFTPAEYDKLAMLVGQQTRHRLPVGEELTAVRAARHEMEARVNDHGCKDPLVVDALHFYDTFRDRLR